MLSHLLRKQKTLLRENWVGRDSLQVETALSVVSDSLLRSVDSVKNRNQYKVSHLQLTSQVLWIPFLLACECGSEEREELVNAVLLQILTHQEVS